MGKILKALLLALILLNVLASVACAQKTVRVGWYESPFNYSDKFGRRSGYAYEYQQKIAAYTGWNYEYVEGNWSDLFDMLRAGEIDLMSDVSYTPARAGQMLFSSLPMGYEDYYIFTVAGNTEISPANIASLNGKRIGVNKNSLQRELFINWAAANGISAQILDLSSLEKDSFAMLKNGEIDAFVALDVYEDIDAHDFIPIIKIGQSNYFFAVSRARSDLLSELNEAMSRINDEDRFYSQQIHEKYLATSGTNALISNDAVNWLSQHGAIRVGYLDDYLPFCASDFPSGVKGVLKDYLALAANCAKNAKLSFETAAYPDLETAFEDLRAGKIDCVFPVNMSAYDGEKTGFLVTSPVMQTEMYVIVRRDNQQEISANKQLVIAVDKLNLNHMTFLRDNFPNWTILDCNGIDDCLSEVDEGTADGAIISNYRLVQTENLIKRYRLLSLTTGKSMNFALAMTRDNGELYYILNKTASLVPRVAINSALTSYSYPENNFSLVDFMQEHWLEVIALTVAAAVLAVMTRERRAKKREQEMAERLAVQNQMLENERKENEVEAMINAVAADYRSVFYFDLDRDRGVCYRAKTGAGDIMSDLAGVKKGDRFAFREKFLQYANDHVAEPYREGFLKFIEPENIRAKMTEEIITAHRYLAVVEGLEYYEMIHLVNLNPIHNQKSEDIHAVSVGFADVDSETREILEKISPMSAH